MVSERRDIKFYVEYPPENLQKTGLSRPEYLKQNILTEAVCGALAERNWGIAIAVPDLDEPTAKLLRDINTHYSNLPIALWLVLPDEKGYWTNENNLEETQAKMFQMIQWVDKHNLTIDGFGFDIEVPVGFNRRAFKRGTGQYVLSALERKMEIGLVRGLNKRWAELHQLEQRGENPRQHFSSIVSEAKHQGIKTEVYTMPKPLANLLSLFEPEGADRVFVMAYSSDRMGIPARPFLEFSLRGNVYPSLGNIQPSTEINPGKIFTPGGATNFIGEEEIKRDVEIIRGIKTKHGVDYLQAVRIFSLTGERTVNWVASALLAEQEKS